MGNGTAPTHALQWTCNGLVARGNLLGNETDVVSGFVVPSPVAAYDGRTDTGRSVCLFTIILSIQSNWSGEKDGASESAPDVA